MGYSIRTFAWPRELVQVKPGVAATFLLWSSCSRFEFWLLQSVELLLVLTLLLANCFFVLNNLSASIILSISFVVLNLKFGHLFEWLLILFRGLL